MILSPIKLQFLSLLKKLEIDTESERGWGCLLSCVLVNQASSYFFFSPRQCNPIVASLLSAEFVSGLANRLGTGVVGRGSDWLPIVLVLSHFTSGLA